MATLETAPVATILVVIFAIVGGIAVVSDDLAFQDYIDAIAVAVAGLAVGRGVAARRR